MNVVRVPVEVSDTAIVLAGVEHDKIHEITDLEVTPDSKIVIHLNLSDGHPFKVRPDGVHFSLVNRDSAIVNKRVFGIVELG